MLTRSETSHICRRWTSYNSNSSTPCYWTFVINYFNWLAFWQAAKAQFLTSQRSRDCAHQLHHGRGNCNPEPQRCVHLFYTVLYKIPTTRFLGRHSYSATAHSISLHQPPTMPPKCKGKKCSGAAQVVSPNKRSKQLDHKGQPPELCQCIALPSEGTQVIETGLWAIQQRQKQDWLVLWICLWIYPVDYKPLKCYGRSEGRQGSRLSYADQQHSFNREMLTTFLLKCWPETLAGSTH